MSSCSLCDVQYYPDQRLWSETFEDDVRMEGIAAWPRPHVWGEAAEEWNISRVGQNPSKSDISDVLALPSAPAFPQKDPDLIWLWSHLLWRDSDYTRDDMIGPRPNINAFQNLANVLSEDRMTALSMASRYGHANLIAFLCTCGANLYARDGNGRTALMEAALWGQLDATRILIRYMHDSAISCTTRPCNSFLPMQAVDFADDIILRNGLERTDRRIGYLTVARDRAESIARTQIYQLLRPDAQDHDAPSALCAPIYPRTVLTTKGHDTHIIKEYRIPNSSCRTVGILNRGEGYSYVSAVSGWARLVGEITPDGYILCNFDWTKYVLHFGECARERYPGTTKWGVEPAGFLDNGSPGAYNASHSGKQLILWFLIEQRFVPLTDFGISGDKAAYIQNGLLQRTSLIKRKDSISTVVSGDDEDELESESEGGLTIIDAQAGSDKDEEEEIETFLFSSSTSVSTSPSPSPSPPRERRQTRSFTRSNSPSPSLFAVSSSSPFGRGGRNSTSPFAKSPSALTAGIVG
jgi:hypothetical protein